MSAQWTDGLGASIALDSDGASRVRLYVLREHPTADSRWGAEVERETPERGWAIVAIDGGGYQHATREEAKRVAEWMRARIEQCTAAQWADARQRDAIVHRAVDAAIGRQCPEKRETPPT